MKRKPDAEPRGYITRPQAARLIGCSTRTLKRYETLGKLRPYARNSRVVVYLVEEINALHAPAAVA